MEKKMDFLKNRMGELALLFALVLVSIYTGVRLGLLLGLVLTFALIIYARRSEIGKKVAPWLQGVLVVVFLISIIDAYLPRTKNKKDIAIARIDQTVSGLIGDLTETQARDMWDIRKDEKGQKFLLYYDYLLSQSRPQEARDTLNKFLKAWDLDRKEQRVSNRDPAQVQSQSQSQFAPSTGNIGKPVVLQPGVYHYVLKAGQRTPWFTTPDCKKYHINTKSETYNQRLYFSDGTDCMDGPAVSVADKYGANVQILAYVDEVVTVTVTLA